MRAPIWLAEVKILICVGAFDTVSASLMIVIVQSTETRCTKAWRSCAIILSSCTISSRFFSLFAHALKLHFVLLLVLLDLLQHILLLHFGFSAHFLELVVIFVSVHGHVLLESLQLIVQLLLNLWQSTMVLLALHIFKFVFLLPDLRLLIL